MKLASTDSLEVKLGDAITTTEPQYGFDSTTYVATSLGFVSSNETQGNFNGTTVVTNVIAAPSSGNQTTVTRGWLANLDTVPHTFFVRKNVSGTPYYSLVGLTLAAAGASGSSASYDGAAWTIDGETGGGGGSGTVTSITAGTGLSGGTITGTGTISLTSPVTVALGGTDKTSVTSAPTASSWAGWDSNENLSAASFIDGYASTATAAGTTTLTVSSKQQQYFTGTTTQIVLLPVASTLVEGQSFEITNLSTGVVTVKSSGANVVLAQPASTVATYTCILNSGTSAASWSVAYLPLAPSGGSGTVTSITAGTGLTGGTITGTGTISLTAPVTVALGGTDKTSVTSAPAASSWAGWDANENLSANSMIAGYASTVTSAGTTTLTAASPQQQTFTGSSNQNVKLPVASTLVEGQSFTVTNTSTGNVTVASSGGNTVLVQKPGVVCTYTCILNSGTTAASWTVSYQGSATGTTGSFGTAGSGMVAFTVTGGIVTAAAAYSIAIAASQVTSGTFDIAQGGTNSAAALTGNQLMASSGGAIVELGAMSSGQIVVGYTSNLPQIVSVTGDWSITHAGVATVTQIQGNAVASGAPTNGYTWQEISGTWTPVNMPLSVGTRLTLSSTIPVTTSDVLNVGTVYLLPHVSAQLPYWDGTQTRPYLLGSSGISFPLAPTASGNLTASSSTISGLSATVVSQLTRGMVVTGTGISGTATIATIPSSTSITLSGGSLTNETGVTYTFKCPASTVYDLFVVFVSGTPQLQAVAWSTSTPGSGARAAAISQQNGYQFYYNTSAVNSADNNTIAAGAGLYVGTFCTNGTNGATGDGVNTRLLWNQFNREQRGLTYTGLTGDWNYTADTWRQADATSTAQVQVVSGLLIEPVHVQVQICAFNSSTVAAAAGIGINSTTVNSAQVFGSVLETGSLLIATFDGFGVIGLNNFNWLEISGATGTTTWEGTSAQITNVIQGGIQGFCQA